MPQFSVRSENILNTCDERLQVVLRDVIEIFDFTVLEGHRNEEDQNAAYIRGASKVRWPNGKHNSIPSRAADIAPYPIDWGGPEHGPAWNGLSDAEKRAVRRRNEAARQRFCYLAGFVMMAAAKRGIKLRWGGDWDSDRDTRDENFRDLPHFEVIE